MQSLGSPETSHNLTCVSVEWFPNNPNGTCQGTVPEFGSPLRTSKQQHQESTELSLGQSFNLMRYSSSSHCSLPQGPLNVPLSEMITCICMSYICTYIYIYTYNYIHDILTSYIHIDASRYIDRADLHDLHTETYIIKGSLDEKLPSYEVLKMLRE